METMDIWARIALKRKHKEATLKALAIAGLMAVSAVSIGAYDNIIPCKNNAELVETTHVVQPGETLWSISEDYLEKNTYGDRYILEFMSGIEELNPWLLDNNRQVNVGDVIHINYFTKGGE
jgi:nucleoid-associated protein YgaU